MCSGCVDVRVSYCTWDQVRLTKENEQEWTRHSRTLLLLVYLTINNYFLTSLNQAYKAILASKDNFKIEGVVKGILSYTV